MAKRRFLLDANVFIEAHRAYYAFDICPGFWDFLERAGNVVSSIDRVHDEIDQGSQADRLKEWAGALPAGFFSSTRGEDVVAAFGDVLTWVQANPRFLPRAKLEFADDADGWLVAYARVHGMVVATRESAAPAARKTVPLPDLCVQFGVEWDHTFAMLRETGAHFSLTEPP